MVRARQRDACGAGQLGDGPQWPSSGWGEAEAGARRLGERKKPVMQMASRGSADGVGVSGVRFLGQWKGAEEGRRVRGPVLSPCQAPPVPGARLVLPLGRGLTGRSAACSAPVSPGTGRLDSSLWGQLRIRANAKRVAGKVAGADGQVVRELS